MKTAKAVIWNAPISTKFSVEVARAIRGKKLSWAKWYLQQVIEKKLWVPVRRYKKDVAHRKGTFQKWKVGRYPVKVAKYFLKLLQNVENNAVNLGMDPEKLVIVHISAHKGVRRPRRQPKGRWRIQRRKATHVFVEVAEE